MKKGTTKSSLISGTRAIYLSVMLLAWAGAFAQTYHYKQYTANDGLPTNAVYGGIQDKNGRIWFYTEKGVSRFDGYEFKNFTVADGLPVNDVWGLTEDKAGRIWVHGFSNQLVAIEQDSIVHYYTASQPGFTRFAISKQKGKIQILEVGHEQVLYLGEAGQLVSAPTKFLLHERPPFHLTYHYNRDTFLRIGGSGLRLRLIASDGYQKDHLIKDLTPEFLRRLQRQQPAIHTLWGRRLFIRPAADSFVYCLDLGDKKMASINLASVFNDIPGHVRFYKTDNKLQIQTDRGLLVIDSTLAGRDTLLFAQDIFKSAHRSFKDREGNYWICTKDRGVFFLTAQQRNANLLTYQDEYQFSVTCMDRSAKGRVIVGTRRGHLFEITNGTQLTRRVDRPEAAANDNQEVNAICFRDDRSAWIARSPIALEYLELNGSGARIAPLSFSSMPIDYRGMEAGFQQTTSRQFLGYSVKDLDWHGPTNRLCVARGVFSYILHYGTEGQAERLELLTQRRAYACAFQPDGKLWLGHVDGLAWYTESSGYRRFEADSLLRGAYILDLYYDADRSTLWIGTDGSGLIGLNTGRAFRVKGTHGLSVQHITAHTNRLWLATNQGIHNINVTPELERTYSAQQIGLRQGLPSVETHAIVIDSQFIYCGSSLGVARITQRERYFNFRHPLLYFAGLSVEGAPVPVQPEYDIKTEPYQVAFHFTGISYKSLGDITYYYQLEGYDNQIFQTTDRSVRYHYLPPGSYRFVVQAEDSNQQRSEIQAIPVVIRSNFWKRTTPWLIGGAALLLLSGLLHRWRLHRIRQQTEQERAINKQFAELELQALQAQMNPHFVFNSLSAIQYFIAANEKEQADTYLSKFAMLMRQFLESSKNRYLNLHQELRLIRLYVELEQMRFPNRFEAQIQVAPDINPYTTLIPTMLLQPFVENAINHGLFHKSSQGRLTLNIAESENQELICTLEDNGVGREAAKLIQQKTGKAYQSRAMQITNERLNALRVIEGHHVDVETTDLKSPTGEAIGTRVVIRIPEIE